MAPLATRRLAAIVTAVVIAVIASIGGSRALEGADAKVEAALGHLRAAWSYARTGNGDLAGMETDAFLAVWDDVEQSLEAAAPGGDADMAALVGRVRTIGLDALGHVDRGALVEARARLAGARSAIREFRRGAGIRSFADCIWDANRVGDGLWTYISDRPDLQNSEATDGVGRAAEAYAAALVRCNETAPRHVARDQEFRRLMDGALASLGGVAQAVERNDGGLLHRYLIEIIALDRLLFFRYG